MAPAGPTDAPPLRLAPSGLVRPSPLLEFRSIHLLRSLVLLFTPLTHRYCLSCHCLGVAIHFLYYIIHRRGLAGILIS
jgi:hypothetical protein